MDISCEVIHATQAIYLCMYFISYYIEMFGEMCFL